MSQIYKSLAQGPISPTVPLEFVTDDGTAIPALNTLNVLGGSGVETFADPNLSDNVFIKVQNSFTNQITTEPGNQTRTITTISLTEIGTYTIEVRAAAWESTVPAGAGFSINGVIRSDGISGTIIGDSDGFKHFDVALDGCNVSIIVVGNDAIVQVVGVDPYTINWGSFSVYVNRGI